MTDPVRTFADVSIAALAACLALAATLSAPLLAATPRAGDPVLVVAPPWSGDVGAAVLAAGGRLIGPDLSLFGTLAVFDTAVPHAALDAAGAWFVGGAAGLAALCGGM